MLKKIFLTILLLLPLALPAKAGSNFIQNVSGKILLQVQSRGEAWYVNPKDLKKYYLGNPGDAFNLMKIFSIGITNKNLYKIPIGLIDYSSTDSDDDGLPDNLEAAIGADGQKNDTDSDGFDDKTEVINNYNPLAKDKLPIDLVFSKINAGKLFLQVEGHGECWYLSPTDNKRYFLANPSQALAIMAKLGLGISNADLEKITSGYFYNQPIAPTAPACSDCQANSNSGDIIYLAGEAIRQNNKESAASYYLKSMKPIIKYTMGFLTADGRLTWSQMLSSSNLISSNDLKKVYQNYVYFQGEKIEIKYYVEKQPDGTWLITNL